MIRRGVPALSPCGMATLLIWVRNYYIHAYISYRWISV